MSRLSSIADKRPARGQAGFILVAVLWILAALATLASIFSLYAINTAAASHVADDRLQAEASIRAGVELAAFQALAPPEPARPTHGAFEAQVGRTKVAVAYRSEGARIDLNAAPKALLKSLLVSLGVDAEQAEAYAERIVGWRKKVEPNAENPEASLYRAAGLPYGPRQAPFENTLELGLVLGLPPQVVERMLPLVTIFSGRAQVDVANAEPAVLAALPGVTPAIIANLLNARAGDPQNPQKLLNLLGPARASATVDKSKAMRAAVEVDLGAGRRVRAEVVFLLSDDGDKPFDILYWRDDFDGQL